MKKTFKRTVSMILACAMAILSLTFTEITASAAGFSLAAGWCESLYAEWPDSNPDAANVKVEYKLSSAASYSSLSGDDLTYLVRKDGSNGRVDIPGLKAGRYDLKVTASDGTVYERTGITVDSFDRSGYAHWNRQSSETAYSGVGAYKDDGTLKDNAIIVYVTDENKDTITLKGYENFKATAANTNEAVGFGNIFNNNIQLMEKATVNDNHPIVIRIIGTVNPPKNLTPPGVKDPILGGGEDDNGFLAMIKKSRNITVEGIGDDAHMNGWGITFTQTATCLESEGQSFEVRNLTLEKYPEDGISFQGDYDNGIDYPIQRIWVHNNVFLPGYCANDVSSDGDKGEGDGSCDFKRGQYFTMSYNHFKGCHKTNLMGSGESDRQWYMTLHHNWYENVASRQPLAAAGNIHIYSTYFSGTTSDTVDTRGKNATFLEENYYENLHGRYFKSRANTCYAKSWNEIIPSDAKSDIKGTHVIATSRDQSVIKANGFNFPDGDTMQDFDINPEHFYYANGKSDVEVLTPAAEVKEYVPLHAGIIQPLQITESGEVIITVKDASGKAVNDATLTGLDFHSLGDGKYSASAELGVSYDITVSKEGYSNVSFKTDIINEDGGTFEKTVTLQADSSGYAAVLLTGGTAKTAIAGATVTISGSTLQGTVLKDKGNGLYQSDNEIALGEYKVTIKDTGDYVEPAEEKTITVKTTNAPTEINLEKYKGTVNVRLSAASGETQPLDVSGAKVTVGNVTLTRSGTTNSFTGKVEVGTPYSISVSLSGWNTVSVIPATITANKDGETSATATLSYKGQLFTWNYTDGTNTDNFFTISSGASDWSDASENPQTYEDYTLTKALKVNSGFTASFEAPADGTITIVMQCKDGSSLFINDTSYNIVTGVNTFPVKKGPVTIKKNKTESHIYFMQYAASGSSGGTVTPDPGPAEPADTPVFTVGTVKANKGGTAVVPVTVSGVNNDLGLGYYKITLTYDSSKLKYERTENNISGSRSELSANGSEAGKVVIAAVNGNDTVLIDGTVVCNVYFTVNDAADIRITADQVLGINNEALDSVSTVNGSVSIAQDTLTLKGDADADGDVDTADAYAVLKYISGIDLDKELIKNYANANAISDSDDINMADVIYILTHPSASK